MPLHQGGQSPAWLSDRPGMQSSGCVKRHVAGTMAVDLDIKKTTGATFPCLWSCRVRTSHSGTSLDEESMSGPSGSSHTPQPVSKQPSIVTEQPENGANVAQQPPPPGTAASQVSTPRLQALGISVSICLQYLLMPAMQLLQGQAAT